MLHVLFNVLFFGRFWPTSLAHPQHTSTQLPPSTIPEPAATPSLDEINQNKYFHEPGGHEPGADDRLGHYDTRYFHGLVSFDERTETLTHMVRAYLTTFQKLGLETWIAHGTLLGWWWNGKILPWDWDVDTQVSGGTLEYMAEHHNRTMHEYISEDESYQRTYLLDVNPWSRQRDPGDGANIIDARWIDMTNGLYIDITGLSEVYPDQKPGIWSCKNFHDYRVGDLYPMRESMFEGVPARIPYAYDQILVEEYRPQALVNMTHEGHRWHEDVKEWVPMSVEQK